jgi:hypothetical protein
VSRAFYFHLLSVDHLLSQCQSTFPNIGKVNARKWMYSQCHYITKCLLCGTAGALPHPFTKIPLCTKCMNIPLWSIVRSEVAKAIYGLTNSDLYPHSHIHWQYVVPHGRCYWEQQIKEVSQHKYEYLDED